MKDNRRSRLWTQLGIDLLVAVFVLLNFAFYHHVLPRNKSNIEQPTAPVVVQPPKDDVEFTYGIAHFENSTRVTLSISAEARKEITASTFFVQFDSSKMEYRSASAGEALLSEAVTVRQDGDSLTVNLDIDSRDGYIFPVVSSSDAGQASSSDAGQGSAVSIVFDCADASAVTLDDFSVAVNPARLLTTGNELATYSLNNGEITITGSGDFSDKYPDKFTSGEVVATENSYKNANVNVTYTTMTVPSGKKTAVCHVFDIYVRSHEYFRTALYQNRIDGGYGQRIRPLTLAKESNAIAAINGDYCTARDIGVVVRNGVLYRTEPFQDIMIMYTDGTMKTFEDGTYTGVDFSDSSIWQVWSFGPALLSDDGQAKTEFNSVVTKANPRSAIGYYEPGHYCMVVVDGRGENNSAGLTMKAFSQFFYDLGCVAAYNLDGGQTSTAVFGDQVVNSPYNGGRSSSDIVYIPRD